MPCLALVLNLMLCLGLWIKLCASERLHPVIPSDNIVRDHVIKAAYIFAADTEVVISTIHVAVFPVQTVITVNSLAFSKPWLTLSHRKIEMLCLVLVLQLEP